MKYTTLPYAQDIDDCLSANIGENGLKQDELQGLLQQANEGLEKLRHAYEEGSLPLLHLPEQHCAALSQASPFL